MSTDLETILSTQDDVCQLIDAAYFHPTPNCANAGRSVQGWEIVKTTKNTPAMGQGLKPAAQF
jgi:hypothetical protein